MDLNMDLKTTTTILVAGESVEVDTDANVLTTIKKLVRERGLGNPVTVIVDGIEVLDPTDLPETFGDHQVEVRRYMKAG